MKPWLMTTGALVALLLLLGPAWRSLTEWRRDRAATAWTDLHRERAAAAEAEGDFALAEATWEAAIAYDPRDVTLRQELLRTRLRRAAANPQTIDAAGRDALRYLVSVSDAASEPAGLVVQGHIALAEGDALKAKTRFEEAIALDTSYVHAHLALAGLHRAAGRALEAQAAFERAAEAAPGNLTALNNLGVQYLDLGRKEDALKRFEQALQVRDNAPSRLNAADALAALGRLDEAVVHLTEAIKLAPTSAEAPRRLGVALQRAGRLAEAEAALRQSLGLQRDAATAKLLGTVYQAAKRFDAAAEVFTQVLKDDPTAHDAAFELARTLEAAGRTADAADLYGRYLKQARGRPEEKQRLAAAEAALAKLQPAPAPPPPAP